MGEFFETGVQRGGGIHLSAGQPASHTVGQRAENDGIGIKEKDVHGDHRYAKRSKRAQGGKTITV